MPQITLEGRCHEKKQIFRSNSFIFDSICTCLGAGVALFGGKIQKYWQSVEYRQQGRTLVVGSKDFTENILIIIAEMVRANSDIVQREMSNQLQVFEPYDFNNTYRIGMLRPRAEELDIEKISDLVKYPDLIAGFDMELIMRDSAKPMFATYSFEPTNPIGYFLFFSSN